MSKENCITRIRAKLKELDMGCLDLVQELSHIKGHGEYSYGYVNMILNQRKNYTLKFITEVAKVLNTSAEFLFKGEDNSDPLYAAKETYHSKIKARLKELGMSYKDLVTKMRIRGYSRSLLLKILSGERSATMQFIVRAAEVLDLTPEHLLTGLSNSSVKQKEKRTYKPAFSNESQYGVIWRE